MSTAQVYQIWGTRISLFGLASRIAAPLLPELEYLEIYATGTDDAPDW